MTDKTLTDKTLTGKTLTDADIADAATALWCEIAAVRAVLDVEASGNGFLEDGRPKILFEAHHFSRLTGGRYDASHPDLSAPAWNPDLYEGGAGEHDRLRRAMELDAKAALMSASWGLFQIMGFNHDLCGFERVEAFVEAQTRHEGRHLMAFVRYCRARGLDRALREHAWTAFARAYNGPAYADHGYHRRLRQAYRVARRGGRDRPVLSEGSRGEWVRRLQERLIAAHAWIAKDGAFGPETEAAVVEFQQDEGLTVDGVVGPRTWTALLDATGGDEENTAAA
jgi:hypothetical protein